MHPLTSMSHRLVESSSFLMCFLCLFAFFVLLGHLDLLLLHQSLVFWSCFLMGSVEIKGLEFWFDRCLVMGWNCCSLGMDSRTPRT